MVNINGSDEVKKETDNKTKYNDLSECNNLIWTMKALDYINVENQENLSRVHVLCCNKCDFLTISLKALQQHMTKLHALTNDDFNNLTIYSCQECKCVSTELKLIQEHIKIFHQLLIENSLVENPTPKSVSILTPSVQRNNRKQTSHIKLLKTQMKIRRKILQRKSMKLKAADDGYTQMNINNNTDTSMDFKKENTQCSHRIEMSQDVNENYPLDMSINSKTCPFKGIKIESTDPNSYNFSTKHDPVNNDYGNSNNNNPLLTNPQTCIELIKFTLNQMLTKTTEQNRSSHIGFSPTQFLQPQFQLSQNIVPLLQLQNNNLAQNDMTFVSKNLDMESILANIQQQNIFNNSSSKAFEANNQMIGYQSTPLFLNHKSPGTISNVTKALFIDNGQKNGSLSISPLSVYNSKKSTDYQIKSTNKRSLKKQPAPTKIRNGLSDDLGFIQSTKFESTKIDTANHENLFNRSFLDTSEINESTSDQLIVSKALIDHDNNDLQINLSCKSSPNTLINDKPHRQNFTSQQNRILSDWFFTHCDKPYPSTEDTKELSQLSGLTYSQVKKWFANKRARSSLNKKNHKNFCVINTTESTMEEAINNDLLSISPSSESNKSYTNHIDVHEAIDFTRSNQEDLVPQDN